MKDKVVRLDDKADPTKCCLETYFKYEAKLVKSKIIEKKIPCHTNQKKAGVSVSNIRQGRFHGMNLTSDEDGHFKFIKRSAHQ